jgi:hypothetical protein
MFYFYSISLTNFDLWSRLTGDITAFLFFLPLPVLYINVMFELQYSTTHLETNSFGVQNVKSLQK